MTNSVRIGLIGCGMISGAYLRAAKTFPILKFVACADINEVAAKSCSEHFGIASLAVDQLLSNDEIEVVLNLTIPATHAKVNAAILQSGKHAYCEKPLGLNVDEVVPIFQLAQERDLRIGCAPDTFLGGGHQTVRHLIDNVSIGRPIAATAFMMSHGTETWHPAPTFFYKEGGGPVFDMGPYYLTSLVNNLGPVRRVVAISGQGFEHRTISSQPLAGTVIDVEVPTHTTGALEFHSGAIATLCMSFDVWSHRHPPIEIHGTDASIQVPDPNGFGGRIFISTKDRKWEEQQLLYGYSDNMRSIGLAEMCTAIRSNRPHRASGELAFHVLEVMSALEASGQMGKHIEITSKVERPSPLPMGLAHGALE